MFSKGLQRAFVIPPPYLMTALVLEDVFFVVAEGLIPNPNPELFVMMHFYHNVTAPYTVLFSALSQCHSPTLREFSSFVRYHLHSEPREKFSVQEAIQYHLMVHSIDRAFLYAFFDNWLPKHYPALKSESLIDPVLHCLLPIDTMLSLGEEKEVPLYTLIEEFYQDVFADNPRVKEWEKDGSFKHRYSFSLNLHVILTTSVRLLGWPKLKKSVWKSIMSKIRLFIQKSSLSRIVFGQSLMQDVFDLTTPIQTKVIINCPARGFFITMLRALSVHLSLLHRE